MAKRSQTKTADAGSEATPHPRQPCPCGSGRRYKACHGSADGPGDVMVSRPFTGLAAECELVALREFVPSATVELPLIGTAAKPGRTVTLGSVLPMAAAALVRSDGTAMVGLQVQTRSNDIGQDLARAIEWATTAEPGEVLSTVGTEHGTGTALRELLDPEAALTPELHADFRWWIPEDTEATPEVSASLERANAAIMPTDRLDATGVHGAYWVDAGEKAHLRWVRPEPEEELLPALAKLQAAGNLGLGDGSRYVGSFRAHGVLVPVWDLDRESHAREWAEPAAALAERIDAALADYRANGLTDAERRTLDGLRNRQVTLR